MTREVLRAVEDVQKWFKENNKGSFAFDTETGGDQEEDGLDYCKLRLIGMSFSNGSATCYIRLDDPELFGPLLESIRSCFISIRTLVAHNLVFDLKVLKKYNIPYGHCKLYCTMVADHLLDENRRHSLKFLAKEILGHEVVSYKDAEKEGTTSKKFFEYAMNDALWTWELCMWQQPHLKEQGLVDLFREIEMPFQHCLVEMETTGFLVDQEAVRSTTTKLEEEITNLEIQMLGLLDRKAEIQHDLFGGIKVVSPINFNSSQQLISIFEERGLQITEKTPSGALSVGRKTIDKFKDTDEFVGLLNKYKIASKLLNAFFAPMPGHIDEDGRVRSRFNDTGTKTGRLSCTKPNLQQLPKVNKDFPVDTRECFIASPGYTMIACDYSGQELRVLTEITREPVLIDTFNKGKDMHLSTANDFFNLGIDEKDLYEDGGNHNEVKDRFKSERNKAKIINFGMAYGKGAYGFSKDFNISEEEAQSILDKYFAALPKVKAAIDTAHSNVHAHGFVSNLAGRRRRFTPNEQGYYPGSALRQSFNFQIQGYSADMIRMAMVKVRKEVQMKYPQWGLTTLATVHDEAVYEVKERYKEEAAEEIKRCFEEAVSFCIPVVADVSMGANYSEAK